MTDLLHIDRAFVLVSLHEKKKVMYCTNMEIISWKCTISTSSNRHTAHKRKRATQGPFGVTLCTVKLSTC